MKSLLLVVAVQAVLSCGPTPKSALSGSVNYMEGEVSEGYSASYTIEFGSSANWVKAACDNCKLLSVGILHDLSGELVVESRREVKEEGIEEVSLVVGESLMNKKAGDEERGFDSTWTLIVDPSYCSGECSTACEEKYPVHVNAVERNLCEIDCDDPCNFKFSTDATVERQD